ncbi:CASP-like protein 4D1 [Olea europaea var. sylvestris]|uniref:CASP-like protein 4D1 n=1 Tax=Olea europaea var. sylvestris TaxID=158386 RepID=UPI000C1D5F78|nr:CASP-like protein 4D1 [Olea europaea var. sylvestris]
MASKAIRNGVLILRIFTLLALAASIALMALNYFDNVDGSEAKFMDLVAYSYVVTTAGIGFVYTLIQIPFAIYNVIKEKRLIPNGWLKVFDFYGDKVVAFLLATGVGVGFEMMRVSGGGSKKFYDRGNISTGLLFVGFIYMAFLSIFSSIRFSSKKGYFK